MNYKIIIFNAQAPFDIIAKAYKNNNLKNICFEHVSNFKYLGAETTLVEMLKWQEQKIFNGGIYFQKFEKVYCLRY